MQNTWFALKRTACVFSSSINSNPSTSLPHTLLSVPVFELMLMLEARLTKPKAISTWFSYFKCFFPPFRAFLALPRACKALTRWWNKALGYQRMENWAQWKHVYLATTLRNKEVLQSSEPPPMNTVRLCSSTCRLPMKVSRAVRAQPRLQNFWCQHCPIQLWLVIKKSRPMDLPACVHAVLSLWSLIPWMH